MIGICSGGGYVPRYRLKRSLIYKAMGWMNPALAANAGGQKAVAGFDEDSITLAVAASGKALRGFDRSRLGAVYLASTSLPYAERLNSAIVAAALGLNDEIGAADFTGGLKSGTTALLAGLDAVCSGRIESILVTASDCRLGKPASSQEMIVGDASAAFVLGAGEVIAEFKGSFSTTCDFVDHFRGEGAQFDRQWEDRWIRDAGYERLIPEAVRGLTDKYGLKISDFSKIVYPCIYPGVRQKLRKILGFPPEAEQTNFQEEIGESGSAHVLVMLAAALEQCGPGDKILLLSFGGGCDALCFQATELISKARSAKMLSASLAAGVDLDNYTKYLAWRNILPVDRGLRAEEDEWTRWSVLWRNRREVLGLVGSKCRKCGTVHYPCQRVCVNPECGANDEMEDHPLAQKSGRVASFTADALAPSLNPPAIYGQIEFEGGGRYLMDLTDCGLFEVKTGMAVSMSFRRKYWDEKRGVCGYFWKAVPQREVANG